MTDKEKCISLSVVRVADFDSGYCSVLRYVWAGRFFTSSPSQHHGYFHIRRAVSHTLSSLRLSSSMERSFPTIEEAKPH